MKSVLFSLSPEQLDEALTAFWECDTKGIQETAEGLRVFFDDDADLSDLVRRFSGREIRAEEPFEYQRCSDAECDPILAGDRFYIASSAHADAPPEGRLRLTAGAGSAFGTGRHETTQLMLEALEKKLQPGCTVVDIGCGSTILAQAALLLVSCPSDWVRNDSSTGI